MEKERVAGSAFGVLLRRHRLAAALSQEALAERARMSAVGIGALERGDRRAPYRETVALIAKALRLSPSASAELEAAARVPRQPHGRVDREVEGADGRRTTNLPSARTSLVGRDSEIADVVCLLQDNRLVTVTGAGGIGKTRTASAVGAALLECMKAGVWLVELAPLARGSFVAPAVAQALGVQESPNRPLLETLLGYLKQKALLLILDNCEHVIAEAARVADALLGGCPQMRILTTSREPLRVAGEYTYRLLSLDVPPLQEAPRLSAAGAARYAAVVLFVQRAQAIDRRFALSDDNAPIVAEVCRRLDGIPLAIELTSARVRILSIQALLTKLDQRLRLLTGGDRTALPRQQTMRALIDWSYDLLSVPEQRLLERLSIFAGGCTLPMAAAVYGDDAVDEFGVLELLTSLVDKSLVIADIGDTACRYRLLESTREYASEKLAALGEAALVAHRHASAYLDLAERMDHEYWAAADWAWRQRAELELDNWRAALGWALGSQGDIVLGQDLATQTVVPWHIFSPVEGRRWLRTAQALIDEHTPPRVAARVYVAAAGLAQSSGELETALVDARRALAVYESIGDQWGVAHAVLIVANALLNLGRVEEAEPFFQRGLEAARSLEIPVLEGFALESIAKAHCAAGDFSKARSRLTEALAIFGSVGGRLFASRPVLLLAEIEFLAGNPERAAQLSSSTTFISKRHSTSSHYFTSQFCSLAAYLIACDRWDDARAHAREALDFAHEAGHDVTLAWAIQHLAAVAALSSPPSPETATGVARLLGYVDARSATLGARRQYTEQREYNRVIRVLRGTMKAAELAKLVSDGATITEDQAIETVRSM